MREKVKEENHCRRESNYFNSQRQLQKLKGNLNFIIELSIRDAVFHLSNYSRIWDQLTAVYPKVRHNSIVTQTVYGSELSRGV